MFIIKIEGDCSFFGVINGLFEREGLRILSLCQNWSPGRNKDKPVNVLIRYSIKL